MVCACVCAYGILETNGDLNCLLLRFHFLVRCVVSLFGRSVTTIGHDSHSNRKSNYILFKDNVHRLIATCLLLFATIIYMMSVLCLCATVCNNMAHSHRVRVSIHTIRNHIQNQLNSHLNTA